MVIEEKKKLDEMLETIKIKDIDNSYKKWYDNELKKQEVNGICLLFYVKRKQELLLIRVFFK
jgi:hypothetical protein